MDFPAICASGFPANLVDSYLEGITANILAPAVVLVVNVICGSRLLEGSGSFFKIQRSIDIHQLHHANSWIRDRKESACKILE